MHRVSLEFYYTFPFSGLISGGIAPPLKILESSWNGKSFKAKMTDIDAVAAGAFLCWTWRSGSCVHLVRCFWAEMTCLQALVAPRGSCQWRDASPCREVGPSPSPLLAELQRSSSTRCPRGIAFFKTPWDRHREQSCGCQGGEEVGEGWNGSLGLADANYYI